MRFAGSTTRTTGSLKPPDTLSALGETYVTRRRKLQCLAGITIIVLIGAVTFYEYSKRNLLRRYYLFMAYQTAINEYFFEKGSLPADLDTAVRFYNGYESRVTPPIEPPMFTNPPIYRPPPAGAKGDWLTMVEAQPRGLALRRIIGEVADDGTVTRRIVWNRELDDLIAADDAARKRLTE